MRTVRASIKFFWIGLGAVVLASAASARPVSLGAGAYKPLFADEALSKDGTRPVKRFSIDSRAVTVAEFLKFARSNPQWTPREIAKKSSSPVTSVTWFAARAYCRAEGGRLPTTDEWEYAASKRALAGNPAWEWTEDFSSRKLSEQEKNDCGGLGSKASDPSRYALFMRYAFRSSLKSDDALRNLGFRCAYDPKAGSRGRASPGIYGLGLNFIDQGGRSVEWKNLEGKVRLVAFIYTRCQGICPMITARMRSFQNRLGPKTLSRVGFTLVSFDWQNDGPKTLKAFGDKFKMDYRVWNVLTSDEHSVNQLVSAFDDNFSKTRNGDFRHSGIVTVLGPNGRIVKQISALDLDTEENAALISRLARETSPQAEAPAPLFSSRGP